MAMQQRRLNIGAHYRRDAQRAHHDRRVGVGRAVAHHHPDQAVLRHFRKRGSRQFVGHQNNALRPGVRPLGGVVEMEQQPLSEST